MIDIYREELSTAAGGACDVPTVAVGNSGNPKSPCCYAAVMPGSKQVKRKTPLPSGEEAANRYAFLDNVIRVQKDVRLDELESALGMYLIGFHFGWKVLYVIHSKKTIRKYEQLLGINVRDVFDDIGPDAERTNAHKIITTVSSFWKFVSGDEKPLIALDRRTMES